MQTFKEFSQVCQMIWTLTRFDYDVIHVHFNFLMNHIVENSCPGSHLSGTGVLEAERHHPVVIYTTRCNECHVFRVFLIHQNLVITCIIVHKWLHLMFGTIVNQNMDVWQRKIILWACFFEIHVVDTDFDFPIFLATRTTLANHVWYCVPPIKTQYPWWSLL